MTITVSQPSISSAGLANSFAPASVSGFVLAEFLFQTPTSCPTDINRCAIEDPIRPVPHTPIFIFLTSVRELVGSLNGHERRRDVAPSSLRCAQAPLLLRQKRSVRC